MTCMCSLCGRTTNQKGELQDGPGVGTARTLEQCKLWKAMRDADPTATAASVANTESDPIYVPPMYRTAPSPLHVMLGIVNLLRTLLYTVARVADGDEGIQVFARQKALLQRQADKLQQLQVKRKELTAHNKREKEIEAANEEQFKDSMLRGWKELKRMKHVDYGGVTDKEKTAWNEWKETAANKKIIQAAKKELTQAYTDVTAEVDDFNDGVDVESRGAIEKAVTLHLEKTIGAVSEVFHGGK